MFIELQTEAFTRSIKLNKGTTFQLLGTLGSTEYITFKQPDGSGGWMNTVIEEEQVQLSDGNTIVTFYGPALIQVNKPVTVAQAGVMVVS